MTSPESYAEHGVGWGCERSFEVEHAIDATLSMGWGGVAHIIAADVHVTGAVEHSCRRTRCVLTCCTNAGTGLHAQ